MNDLTGKPFGFLSHGIHAYARMLAMAAFIIGTLPLVPRAYG